MKDFTWLLMIITIVVSKGMCVGDDHHRYNEEV